MDVEPMLALVSAAGFGLAFGSFLNVCILRLPHDDRRRRSLFTPPSTCPSCGHRIGWRDNVPIFSWLLLRGRCRWCKKPISAQYPLIEAVVALLWVAAVLYYGFTLNALAAAVFGTILLGIAVTDGRHQIIPHEFTYSGIILGLLLSLRGGAAGFLESLLGAAAGFGLIYAIAVAGQWILKEEAMGGGDVMLMAMVGAFVGWKGVLLTVFLGALIGMVAYLPDVVRLVSQWLGLRKRGKSRPLPFGVFLAIAAGLVFVTQDAILAWYQHFLSTG